MKFYGQTIEKEDFFNLVYQICRRIPKGSVTSYGAIAKALGSKTSARMVGWAMNASHNSHEVPAHRVVNRLGQLSGKAHFFPPCRMQELLEKEGLSIKNDKILDFKNHFWDPLLEL